MPKTANLLTPEAFAKLNAQADELAHELDTLAKEAECHHDESPEGSPLEVIGTLNRLIENAAGLNRMLIARRRMAEHAAGIKRRIHAT